ncbi:MAG: biotin-dependent carboxyltransferase [Verrucomicrobia bacterium]|nr:biotin-dependent carboxyltransferase [Verrucomicrobiota bacterium]
MTRVFEVLTPGLSASVQDQGRLGWRRFGVPASGAMDDHAAAWANRLLDNPPDAPVLELLLQGARLAVVEEAWIAVAGADAQANVPTWRIVRVRAGDQIHFPRERSGVWIYLAVEGGFEAERILGSASAYERGGLGRLLTPGDILCRKPDASFRLVPTVAGRSVAWSERRDYDSPPPLRVWPGPQWNCFSEHERESFFAQEWTVTSRSDRAGYRLTGIALKPQPSQIISEPVRVGSIQVPGNGQPIVIMRDGPTVGGYPKIGMVDPADVSWLAQCRPGAKVRFRIVG